MRHMVSFLFYGSFGDDPDVSKRVVFEITLLLNSRANPTTLLSTLC